MKPKARKFFAFLATAAGLFLLGSELLRFEGGVQWFWILVAGLLVLLGLAELLSPTPPDRL